MGHTRVYEGGGGGDSECWVLKNQNNFTAHPRIHLDSY